jgi:hypothetical protein
VACAVLGRGKEKRFGSCIISIFVGEFVAEIVPALCSLFFKSASIVEVFCALVSMVG